MPTNQQNATFENQDEQSRFVSKRMSNVKSDLIEITHDKLENILMKHLKNLDIRKSWITPFSILLTALITKLTADFKDALGIPKTIWEAFFLLILIGSTIWLVWRIVVIVRCWDSSSLDFLIKQVKNQSKTEN